MDSNKTRQRIKELAGAFEQTGETEELNKQYNKLDYELKCSIKGAVKKVVRANFGYYRSPALIKAGKNVLVWKVIWSCRKRKQQLSNAIKNRMWVTGQSEKSISQLTMLQIRIEMRKAVTELREIQMYARRMREL